jgi:hypothetical protein
VDCIRGSDIFFQPYGMSMIVWEEVTEALRISQMRIWFRSIRSWELYLGERTLRQMDIPVYVPIDPPMVLTIKDYAPAEPRDAYRAGVDYPKFILQGVSYPKWFSIHSLGPILGF